MPLSSNCWKCIVLTFNVLFAMSALVLFATSGWLLYRLFVYRHFVGLSAQYPVILLLMMSIITVSVAWIGWRTASSMYHFHVIVTGVLIFIVVAVEFSCFIWAMVVWDSVEIDIKTTMSEYFMNTVAQEQDPNSADAVRWDRLHVEMQCCGVSGHKDFSAKRNMPFSCCGQGPLDSLHMPYVSDCTMIYQRGCAKPLLAYVRAELLVVAGVALIASVVQSSGIFCTFFLAQSIIKNRRASIALRANNSVRASNLGAADDSLLQSPSAPVHTLPKY